MLNNNLVAKIFIYYEIIGAWVLLIATIIALGLSNSALADNYFHFFHNHDVSFLINDGLMTIFFLVVGLEIKYELLQGALNTVQKAILPIIGALGGVLLPVLIYIIFNYDSPLLRRGWAVPMATDIAFALSILSFLGSRVAPGLRVFLATLAIIDDLEAIIVIAFFYTAHLAWLFFGGALLCMLLLFLFNRWGWTNLLGYFVVGALLWFCFLKAGIHPTLSGVAVALMMPLSLCKKLQQALHPWTTFIIVPLFVLANAGVSFLHLDPAQLHVSIILGVLCGLFFGKQLGIFIAAWLAVKCRLAMLPEHVRWRDLYGVAIVGGIGFTMSLFIGALSYGNAMPDYFDSVKIGVLLGSVLSGVVGYGVLRCFCHAGRPQ